MSDVEKYLEALRQKATLEPKSGSTGSVVSEAIMCPTCKTPLDEKHQIGPGDRAAVMANLGVMEVKLRCPGCNTVVDVTLPRGYEWKSSIDIPGWGTFPGQASTTEQPACVTPAAWYADPLGRHQYRYWDGASWTDHVADDGRASVDPLERVGDEAEDEGRPASSGTGQQGAAIGEEGRLPKEQPSEVLTERPYGEDKCAHYSFSRELNANPEVVWAVLTDASMWVQWHGDAISDVSPDWVRGGEVRWQSGSQSLIAEVREGEQLSLVGPQGTWLTWEIAVIAEGRVKVTLAEDRRTPLTMQGAFARHGEISAVLRRLAAVIEPNVELVWDVELADGGDKGSRHGPVATGDGLIVVTGRNLHSLSNDGGVRWSYETDAQDSPDIPVAEHGLVLFRTVSGKIVALDTKTGAAVWERKDLGADDSSVVSDGERAYLTTRDGRIIALNAADGGVAWVREEGKRFATPVVQGNGLYACAGHAPLIIALDARTGETAWTAPVAGFASPAIGVDSVFVSVVRGIAALFAKTGESQWMSDFSAEAKSMPVLTVDRIYVKTGDCTVWCLDHERGEVVWRYSVPSQNQERYPEAPGVGDGVVCCAMGGALHAFDADNGTRLWAHGVAYSRRPAIVGGTVYFLDDRRLCAADVRNQSQQG